jgi:hypothetical protein
MSESFTDDLDRYAGLEEQGRMGVSQVVEPNPGQAGSTDELRERIRQQLRVGRFAVGPSEDMAVGVVTVELGIFVLTVLPQVCRTSTVRGSRLTGRRAVRDLPLVSWSS